MHRHQRGILFSPEPTDGSDADTKPEVETTSEQEKTFTQSELDAIIKKRLAEQEKRFKADSEKEKMNEIDRIKAEKQEVENKQKETENRLKQTRLETLVLKFATKAGIKPERIDYVLRMLDVSEINFDEELKPDSKQVESAIAELVKTIPELVTTFKVNSGGTQIKGNSGEPLTREAIRNMSREDLAKNRESILDFYLKNS